MRRWTRWIGLPGWAQLALAVYAICFLEGAGSHVWDLTTRGIHAYDAVWWPSQALYFSLVALDAIAVHLALRAHPAVVPLGVAIMASDLNSNWHYNWSAIRADPALFWAPVGLLPMSLFGLFVAALGVPLWRVLRRRDAGQATPDIS
jgi:hypothetical protein